ncbi:murein transglycosylase A [Lacibacterium aquatile]|uniref:peptidoglycan lytic exotransglycosylase n=1 Tax=Lacibacterium aquatile TaxID=1168082 RepID=A0ABW5E0W7_9PROT
MALFSATARLLAAASLTILAACGTPGEKSGPSVATDTPEKLSLSAVGFNALPDWSQDDPAAALPALKLSCGQLLRQADDRAVGPDGMAGKVADWRPACTAVQAATPATVRAVVEKEFQPYEVRGKDGTAGLYTGYYEPELRGSRRREGAYQTPLYRRPDDLVTVELVDFRADWKGERIGGRVVDGRLRPYPDRAAIEGGAIAGRGLELVWVDDAIEAFFLQIQGSGRVKLPDGKIMRVGYAAQNGRPYNAIGRDLIRRGALTAETVSMQSIQAWLEKNPGEAKSVMNLNPSFVFFRELQGDGPLGAQNLPLTPGRSIAVDPKFMPLGAPVFLDLTLPDGKPLRRLTVAQDTGGAIRGAVRADVFWGAGADAAELAGKMKQPGRYFLLLPKALKPPVG